MRYFISDTHFFHRNILKLNPLKRKEGFEEAILENLKITLKDDDVLYHLGDFSWKLNDEFLKAWKEIPGKKILVKGNHDFRAREGKLRRFFDEVIEEYAIIKIKGKRVLLSHYPALDLRTYRFPEIQEKIVKVYFNNSCSLLVHGHVHWNRFGVLCGCHLKGIKCKNVNVEFTDYKPVSEEELV
ncbi:MAG: metallophosphoesterase family protein [Desulfurobacteriaceae bacterium]